MREKTVMGDGRERDGNLRRSRGGRRKEKGITFKMWNTGSIEDWEKASAGLTPLADWESDFGAISLLF